MKGIWIPHKTDEEKGMRQCERIQYGDEQYMCMQMQKEHLTEERWNDESRIKQR